MFDDADFISKRDVKTVALNAIKSYKKRHNENDLSATATMGDKALLVQRVQNVVVEQIAFAIKDEYRGEYYRWLPSDAAEPDPEHQLNYGKTFQIGVGEMPGERYGCRCAMEILVKGSKLEL